MRTLFILAISVHSVLGVHSLQAQSKSLVAPTPEKEILIYAPNGLPFDLPKEEEDSPDPNAGARAQDEVLLDSILSSRQENCNSNLTQDDLTHQAEAAINRIYNSNQVQVQGAQVQALQREITMNAARRLIANQGCNQDNSK